MLIIHLQAKQPDTKAATKPTISDRAGMSPAMASPFINFMPSSSASPKMGGMTIRKENWASLALSSPSKRPVAMVLPERFLAWLVIIGEGQQNCCQQ